jgi:agmatine deiminase
VARFVCARAGVESLPSDLILEGGGIEVDGEGTAIITESCVLNDNRNPGWSKADVEAELGALLGLEKIIWLPGIAGKDITDGHTDFYARFARPGVVVAGFDPDPESFDHDVTARHLDILESATDAKGRSLEVVVLEAPSTVRPEFESDDFAAGYINFYVCNGAVIAPEFGDPEADGAARQELERLFPDRQVVQINIDAIAAGGGGIHCTTQQEPAEQAPAHP